jgi:GNAT superfamily N-acetyltransferase
MNIEHSCTPETADIDFLSEKINQETPGFGSAHSFAFFVRDEKGQIIAGCNGSVIFGSIYTDQLWVHLEHRGKGLGYKLMAQVHDYGRENECAMATVATMSFQGAKAFYEKLGYVVDFERAGYTQNSSCIFLKRSL